MLTLVGAIFDICKGLIHGFGLYIINIYKKLVYNQNERETQRPRSNKFESGGVNPNL